MKKIIDGDNMVLVGYFQDVDQEQTIQKYLNLGFEEVLPDNEGDLVLYRNSDQEEG